MGRNSLEVFRGIIVGILIGAIIWFIIIYCGVYVWKHYVTPTEKKIGKVFEIERSLNVR